MAAFKAWGNCAPDDAELHKKLILSANQPPYSLQKMAIVKLGQLFVQDAVPHLIKLAGATGDINIKVLAETAVAQIERLN